MQTLQRRNGAVEVYGVIPSDNDRLTPTYRVRLLEMSDQHLILERPNQVDAAQYFRLGAEISLLAVDGDARWQMFTKVERIILHQLNAEVRVPAVVLTMPQSARSAQRRRYFRVMTAGAKLSSVLLTPIEEEPPAASPPNESQHSAPAEPPPELSSTTPAAPEVDLDEPIAFFGKLLNVGGGGIGVEAPQRVADQLRRVSHYRCRLDLPMLNEPMEIRAMLVHLEPLEGGTHYMGLCFEFKDRLERRRCEDRICQFTAWYQRQQLQRVRGA